MPDSGQNAKFALSWFMNALWKFVKPSPFLLFVAALLVATIGCQTGMKERGVFTTLALQGPLLDLPASGYKPQSSFASNEIPAAVITGYGIYNQQQSVTLELVELQTGRSLATKEYHAVYERLIMQPLPIRLSGDYRLKLTVNGAEHDSWDFSVTRTNGSVAAQGVSTNAAPKYASGWLSLRIQAADPLFANYDNQLKNLIMTALTEQPRSAAPEMYAQTLSQRKPGRVVMRCGMDFQGRITNLEIPEKTIDDDLAELFQRNLLKGSPYAPWPQDLREKFGLDSRKIVLGIYLD